MPEGPEVETVRATLAPQLVGQRLGHAWVSPLPLRTPVTAAALAFVAGGEVQAVLRKGKLLWIELGGQGLMVRLGMTGQLTVERRTKPAQKHTHLRLPLLPPEGMVPPEQEEQAAGFELRYVDPRRFGEVVPYRSAAELAQVCARMGPDPLSWSDHEKCAVMRGLLSTQRAVKEALLDQRLLSGVGNIYAAEALFWAQVAPHQRGCDLSQSEVERVVGATEQVLAAAVRNRGTSFSNYVDARGEKGTNQNALAVFGREGEPCPRCEAPIARVVQGTRSTFWCERCQN